MKAFPKWLVHLFPSRGLSFRQRFVGVLVTWGLPAIILEVIQSGVLRAPSELPYLLAIEVAATLIGVSAYAILEHIGFALLKEKPSKE